MQVHALDENRLLSAISADKGRDYRCPECLNPVRLRRGEQRQSHFFHLRENSACRQSQKGVIHLRLQRFIQYLFEDAKMEHSFPDIGRIADVFVPQTKIVYEIQYSPISLEEAKERCNDYESIGCQTIWILHDDTFNQKKLTPSELFLRTKTCYYSNMDDEGSGGIYDQFENFRSQVHLRQPHPLPLFHWPQELLLRESTWPIYHKGDCFDLALKGNFDPVATEKSPLLLRLKEGYITALELLLQRMD